MYGYTCSAGVQSRARLIPSEHTRPTVLSYRATAEKKRLLSSSHDGTDAGLQFYEYLQGLCLYQKQSTTKCSSWSAFLFFGWSPSCQVRPFTCLQNVSMSLIRIRRSVTHKGVCRTTAQLWLSFLKLCLHCFGR